MSDAPFFRCVSTTRATGEGMLARVLAGEIDGVVVDDAFPADVCARWSKQLDAGRRPVAERRFAVDFDAYSIGPCLDQCEGGLAEYLARVRPYEDTVRADLAPFDPFAQIMTVMQEIAGTIRCERATTKGGHPYALATLRRLPPGGFIPPHCEDEQLPRPSYDELRDRIDGALFSYFVVVRPADEGGELSVHDLPIEAIRRTSHGHSAMDREVAQSRRMLVAPKGAAMLVFAGGRRFHQVLPVAGTRARWTLGGFLARARTRDHVKVWA